MAFKQAVKVIVTELAALSVFFFNYVPKKEVRTEDKLSDRACAEPWVGCPAPIHKHNLEFGLDIRKNLLGESFI
jgi:hypothetical protein